MYLGSQYDLDPNSTDTSMPYAIDKLPSIAKSTSYKVHCYLKLLRDLLSLSHLPHRNELDRHLHAIRHQPAPINCKIYVLRSALIPRLTYTSQFVPPTPAQLEVMDKKILKWGRQILRLTPTIPAAVLSSPHLLQLPMPSDAIQTSQLRCFWRRRHRGPRQAAFTNRLLQQALRQQANYTTNSQAAAPLQSTPTKPGQGALWAHTIAKLYADSGLGICKPPTANTTGPPSIINSCPTLAPVADQLQQHALTMVSDLHTG